MLLQYRLVGFGLLFKLSNLIYTDPDPTSITTKLLMGLSLN